MQHSGEPPVPAPPEGPEALRESLQDYAVIRLDPKGKILQWSEGAERIFGYTAAEVIGRDAALLFIPEDQAANRPAEELDRAREAGVSEDERWHLCKDGRRIWLSGTVRPVRDQSGELTGFTKLARDITSKKLEDLQREALLQREQAARRDAERRWKDLEQISENVPAFIALVRLPDQVYVFVNRMFRSAVGKRELIGRSFREAHLEIGPELIQAFDEVAATGKAFYAVERQIGERYFDFVYQPMRSEAGQYEAILIFAVDVTERVGTKHDLERLTRELQDEGERLKAEIEERKRAEDLVQEQAALINLAHDAILTLRLDGRIEFWNWGAEETYGWKQEEVLGRNVHDLLHSEYPDGIEAVKKLLLSEGQWNGELRHTRRDGQVIEVSSRWVLWRRDGKPYGWLEINRDITEHKRMEAHLRDTQKMESLGVLAGGIAHDFNNLLTGIMGNVSLAMDIVEPESQVYSILTNSLRASEQAAFLTKQILAYAGKGQFLVQTVDLSSVVRQTVALIGSSIPRSVKLDLELTGEAPPVQADIRQLQQVVMNLIFNAAEAIGERPGRILVRTQTRTLEAGAPPKPHDVGVACPGSYAVLEVQDTGPGIEPLVRKNMFDPFFTTKFTGRGLGLAAVSGIVRSLDGAVAVDSAPGEGTTFRVLLPAKTAAKEQEPEPVRPILVVDDELIVRRTAEAMLKKRGHDVVVADSGQAALDLFRKLNGNVALVLLDMSMPLMGGEEVFRRMLEIRSDVPVIVCSGYTEQEAIRRFGGLGVAGFLQKPYTVQALMEKIGGVLKT